MAIVTIRPEATVSNTMALVGHATPNQATADNSDTSYIEAPYGNFSQTIFTLPDYAFLLNTYLKQVRVRVRYQTVGSLGGGTYWVVRLISSGSFGPNQAHSTVSATPVEAVSGWQTTAPSGAPWSQAELNALQVDIFTGYYSGAVVMPRIFEVYIDLDFNYLPVATVLSPANGSNETTTTRPTVYFAYSDSEGDAMDAYRVKLFKSDVFNAVGFDPNTSTPAYDTGKVGAQSPPAGGIAVNFDLANNTAYRWYVWVYQTGGVQGTTGYGVSAPAVSEFNMLVAAPSVPNLNTTVSNTGGYVAIEITAGGGSPSTATVLLERSYDQVTWATVRNTPMVPPGTIFDYEVIPNKPVYYRGRSKASTGIASEYSIATPGVTLVDNEWRLKDPIAPSRNIAISVVDDRVTQKKPEDKAFFAPMGRTRKIAVTDVIRGEESTFTLEFRTDVAYESFELLRNSQRTLMLTRGWTKEGWYIQFEQVREMTLYNYSPTYRTVTISWIEMDPP